MNVSVVLRLVPRALMEGRVCGHAEIVDTGEAAFFKDLEEMVAFLQAAGSRDRNGDEGQDVLEPSGS
jgi:hypothetical protein